MEIRVAERANTELECALCHQRLPKLCARCELCGTRLHFACRGDLTRCPTLGCASGPHETVVGAPPGLFREVNERRKRRVLGRQLARTLGLAALTAGAVCALASALPMLAERLAARNVRAACGDMARIELAISAYYEVARRSPHELNDLRRAPRRAVAWRGPYLDRSTPNFDPWGERYVLRPLGPRGYELICYGADGVPGGDGADQDLRLVRSLVGR